MSKCKGGCGIVLKKDTPQTNGYCVDCFAARWDKIIGEQPMTSPESLMKADGRLPK